MIADVTCLGIVVADVVGKTIDRFPDRGRLSLVERMELHSGGCAANTGISLARLGVKTAIAGKVGRDGFGDFLDSEFRKYGLDTAGLARDNDLATAATMVLVHADGERSFLHYLGANARYGLQDIDMERALDCRILHIAGALVMPELDGLPTAELLKQARAKNVITSLDTVWDASGNWLPQIAPCLPYVDYFLPSLEEARMLAGGIEQPREIARFLAQMGAGTIAIKMGSHGSYVLAPDGAEIATPALPVSAIDALGAGDAYVAGFLAALLKGSDLDGCARFACAVGACCVQALGATTGVLSYSETEAFMR
ncbi:MAG TPA: sugar kinase, partial [Chthonomonadales bacterium]|nr:sugar kinase [Chthonomonadales bacterium]